MDLPKVVSIHCLAHRLELSWKDFIKTNSTKLYDKVTTLTIGIYYLYKRSSKMRKELKATFSVHNEKCHLPTRVGGTRWVPHILRAIDLLLKGFHVFADHLSTSSHTHPKAEGLYKMMTEKSTVAFMIWLQVSI